ncbi:hypothetical protein M440DRAFT_1337938, partial [Trichoderma longibrachiatum ATCC 18648]
PPKMHLIKQSRRILSDIFHARQDSNPTPTSHRSKASRSRRRRLRRRTSSPLAVARGTMARFLCKGEKRKRESLDDGHDDEWEFVPCKKRLVGGGLAQGEGVGEEHTELGDVVRCVNDIPYSQPYRYEDSGEEPDELPDDYEELLGKVHSSLENLTITDTHNSPPSSRASTHQTHTDIDCVWLQDIHDWENRYRARRCHSETSTRILPYANAVTGELPDGSGRRLRINWRGDQRNIWMHMWKKEKRLQWEQSWEMQTLKLSFRQRHGRGLMPRHCKQNQADSKKLKEQTN